MYTPVANVNYEFVPEANYESVKDKYGYSIEKWMQGEINIDQAMDSDYNNCIALGADGLVRFDFSFYYVNYTNQINPLRLKGIRISGTAIKRGDDFSE